MIVIPSSLSTLPTTTRTIVSIMLSECCLVRPMWRRSGSLRRPFGAPSFPSHGSYVLCDYPIVISFVEDVECLVSPGDD